MTDQDPGPTPFGAEMERRRTELELTWEQLAAMTGMSVSGLRRLKRGWERKDDTIHIANPYLSTAITIAKALKWPVEEAAKLAGYDPHEIPATPKPIPMTTTTVGELWPRLTKKQQDLVIEIVRQFAANNKVDHRTRDTQELPFESRTTVTSLFSHIEQ